MSDYQEAVQHPASCFRDPQLRRGVAQLDRLGLPLPVTGNFASVYRIVTGGTPYAARCFLRHRPDHEHRYTAIGHCLRQHAFGFTVNFEYQGQGIRVRNQWYPLVKMEWARGLTLGAFVESHLGDPAALARVSRRLHQIISQLRAASIAHGDLQLGNVLVAGDDIKLIDYDGMYVPRLRGLPAPELGHPHFQHPGRSTAHFGSYLDDFSLMVITISLAALQVEPGLWQELQAGDDCLLLRREDFRRPGQTRAWQVLEKIKDPSLATWLERLQHCLAQAPDRAVPLEWPGPVRVLSSPRWHPAPVEKEAAAAVTPADWITQFVPASPPVRLVGSFWLERVTMLLLVAWCGAVIYWSRAGGLRAWDAWRCGGGGVAALGLGLALRYAGLTPVREKHRLAFRRPLAQWRLARLRRRLFRFQARYDRLLQARDARIASLDAQEARLRAEEKTRIQAIHRQMEERLRALSRERDAVGSGVPGSWLLWLASGAYRAVVLHNIKVKEAQAVQVAAARQASVSQELAARLARVAVHRREVHRRYDGLGLERQLEELTAAVAAAQLETGQLRRQLSGYHQVTPMTYLRSILGLQRGLGSPPG